MCKEPIPLPGLNVKKVNSMYATGMKLPCNKSMVEICKEKAYFMYYRDKNLCYKTDSGFVVQIPIDQCGTDVYKYEDRALVFMRWIRPQYQEALKTINEPIKVSGLLPEVTATKSDIMGSSLDGFRGDHSAFD